MEVTGTLASAASTGEHPCVVGLRLRPLRPRLSGGGALGPAPDAATYIVGTAEQSTPESRAESLLILVNCIADNGDTIKVRAGNGTDPALYQFAPWAAQPRPGDCAPGSGSPRNGKPLRIQKEIQLVADIDRIILDGGAGGNIEIGDDMCSDCFTSPESPDSCSWAKTTNADTVALIVVNRSRMSENLKNASNLRIENFEIRNSFRTWEPEFHHGYIFTNNDSGACGVYCHSTAEQPVIPGAGIEIWRAKITIENCRLWRNSTTTYAGRGGGIFASASNLTVDNCVFEENYGGYYGGGIFASDGAFGSCSPCCDTDSFPHDPVTITVKNSRFRNNLAEFGAGLQIGKGNCPGSQPELKVVIQNNWMTEQLFCSIRR